MTQLNKASKVCFISHNATRTGAPLVLFHLVKWLQQNTTISCHVLFLEAGEMVSVFEQVCSCSVLPSVNESGFLRRSLRFFVGFSSRKHAIRQLPQFDVIFFNAAPSLQVLQLLPQHSGTRKILWLHEQPLSIEMWYQAYFTRENLMQFDEILSVSADTINFLENRYQVPVARLHVEHPFVDVASLVEKQMQYHKQRDEQSERPFVIGGSGLQDWRKGPDLFLRVARKVRDLQPSRSFQFVWVGAESGLTHGLRYEAAKLGLQSVVEFTGAQSNPAQWFDRFDVFLLTSREDPFPLVVLEAAAFEKPVLCFDGIGDITKLVRLVPENVVPYSDTDAMAERVVSYINRTTSNSGSKLRSSIETYDVNQRAPVIAQYISPGFEYLSDSVRSK